VEQLLVVFVFGFPAVFMLLSVSVIGVLREKYWLGVLGAMLFIPFSYYLNGALGSGGFAIFLPLFQIGSAAAVHKGNKRRAWILLVPAFLASLWVIGLALLYQFWS